MPQTDDRGTVRRGTVGDDFELFEEEGQFILTVEMPGFERDDITVSWDEGRLFVTAGDTDTERGRRRRFRRTFRFPQEIEPDEIEAQYRNGILEVRLPTTDAHRRGTEIEVEGS